MRPITPQPGFVAQDVIDLLSTREFIYADCYTIRPRFADPLRYTTRDRDVAVEVLGDDVVFSAPGSVILSGIKLKVGVGIEVDEQELVLRYNAEAEILGKPIAKAILLGRLDGSTLERTRFFARSPGSPWMGSIPMFLGKLSNATKVSQGEATFSVKSDLVTLNTRVPTDLYQPGCNHVVYDQGCGLNREDRKVTGTAGAGSNASRIVSGAAIPQLALGVLYINSADGVTIVRTIKAVSGSNIELAYPLDFVPTVGMAFTAYEGCDRTRARCNEFGNEARYKGFPYVPVAETAV